MSTANCLPSAAPTSRPGSPVTPRMPSGCDPGAPWPRCCTPAMIPSPRSRYRRGATQMRYAKTDKDGALFWADRGVGYVVSGGGADRDRLTKVAQAVYDQAEKNGG